MSKMHPSSRAVNSDRELGPWTRVVETDLYVGNLYATTVLSFHAFISFTSRREVHDNININDKKLRGDWCESECIAVRSNKLSQLRRKQQNRYTNLQIMAVNDDTLLITKSWCVQNTNKITLKQHTRTTTGALCTILTNEKLLLSPSLCISDAWRRVSSLLLFTLSTESWRLDECHTRSFCDWELYWW